MSSLENGSNGASTSSSGTSTTPTAARTVRLIWVRHGETADNARQVVQGHIDTALNETGIQQARTTQEYLKDTHIDICFTSDLQRASKTAEIILEDYHAETPLVIDPRIKEKSLGLMEGQKYYAYESRTPEVLASIEPLETFTARLLDFWDALFPSHSKTSSNSTAAREESDSILPSTPRDLTVLVVTHGGPVKVAFFALPKKRKNIIWIKEVLDQAHTLKFKIWNCSISEILMQKKEDSSSENDQEEWLGTITRYSDIEHLLKAGGEGPKEGTEGDTVIAPTSAEEEQAKRDKDEAERQYHIDNAGEWFKQE